MQNICEKSQRFTHFLKASIVIGIVIVAVARGCSSDTIGADTAEAGSTELQNDVPVSRYAAIAKGQIDLEDGIIRLAASREGLVREVLVNEGDFVKRGQVLLVVDDQQARLQLDQAHDELEERRAALGPLYARLTVAEREVTRLAPLAQAESVPRQELDKAAGEVAVLRSEIIAAQASVVSAVSRVKVAEYEVEQRLVRAPLDGQIIRKQAKPGDGISTLNVTSLFLFAPESPRIIRADLEERFVSTVKPGMPALISPQDDEEKIIAGKVLRIGRVFGKRGISTDDPADKQDVRTVECVLSVEDQTYLIGQRVLVRILRQ